MPTVARLAIVPADEQEALEVDLWGDVFQRVPITRTRQRKLKELDVELQALDADAADADDQAVEVMARMLDCILAPLEGQKKPSTAILKKWKADELAFAQLATFVERLGDGEDPS